jgi:hypothetical protein
MNNELTNLRQAHQALLMMVETLPDERMVETIARTVLNCEIDRIMGNLIEDLTAPCYRKVNSFDKKMNDLDGFVKHLTKEIDDLRNEIIQNIEMNRADYHGLYERIVALEKRLPEA